jgi:hypothetical protein
MSGHSFAAILDRRSARARIFLVCKLSKPTGQALIAIGQKAMCVALTYWRSTPRSAMAARTHDSPNFLVPLVFVIQLMGMRQRQDT